MNLRSTAWGTLALTCLLGFCSPRALLAATPIDPNRASFALDVWHEAHGLPQSRVRAVVQTRDGYLWLGTAGGLVRFDGVNFTAFTVATGSLRDNEVWALKEDSTGALWIGTAAGLTRLAGGKFQSYTRADGLPDDWVRQIDVDPAGGVWIATPRGICRFDGRTFTAFTTKDGLANDLVLEVRAGLPEGVYVISAFQLHRFVNGRFVLETGIAEPADGWLTNISTGADGALWLAFERGTVKRRQAGNLTVFSTLNDPTARGGSVQVDAQGNVWLSRRSGLFRLQGDRFEPALSSEANARLGAVLALGTDREGSLWLGLEAAGLARVRRTKFATLTVDEGLPENSTRSVIQDRRGGTWIGTVNRIAHYRDGQMTHYSDLDGVPIGNVTSLAEDPDGVIWFGAAGELLKIKDGRLTKDPNWRRVIEIKTIYRDPQGRMWIGTQGDGLFRFDAGGVTNFRRADGLPSEHIRGLLMDRQGALWVGTLDGGIARFSEGKFTTFTTKDGLSSDRVLGVYEDNGGTIWITTRSGLARYRDGKFVNFRTQDGLFSDFISSMLDDGRGYYWFSCSQGIFRTPQTDLAEFADGKRAKIRSEAYGLKDGLKTTAFGAGLQPNAWRASDGKLLFASLHGIVQVDPSRLTTNTLVPPVYIEQVKINRQPVPLDQPAVAPPGTGEIEIAFTALSFLAPDKVRFKYRLEGYDTAWVEAGTRRFAYYASLPSGDYRFRVLACNEDGLWNETGAEFALTLQPYYYEQGWFFAVCGLLVVGLAVAAHRFRLAQLKASEQALKQRVTEAMASVKVLRGLLPICASCKNVRDDKGYWNQIEDYLHKHSDTQITHGVCPHCIKKLYPDLADEILGTQPPKTDQPPPPTA